MAFLGKKYTLVKSEGFEELLQAVGLPEDKCKKAAGATSSIELTESGGVYTLNISSDIKSQTLSFRLGEEIDEDTIDGRKVKTVFTMQGNTLTQLQKGEKTGTITREFGPSELKQVMNLGGVVCTRIFKA